MLTLPTQSSVVSPWQNLFANCPELLANSKPILVDTGDILFEQNEPAHYFYFLESGLLKLEQSNSFASCTLQIFSSQAVVASLLMSEPPQKSPGNLIALAPSRLMCWDRYHFINVWLKNPAAVELLHNEFRERIFYMQRNKKLSRLDIKTRLWHFLNWHYLTKKDLKNQKVTRKQIAQLVDAKTETVIRVLSELEKNQIIKTKSSVIQILKPQTVLEGAIYDK